MMVYDPMTPEENTRKKQSEKEKEKKKKEEERQGVCGFTLVG